jgi:pyruvate formate lyase activating enzyme
MNPKERADGPTGSTGNESTGQRFMRIGGLQPVSLIDYPGRISCVVFLAGCNFRCPYCHNPQLTGDPALHAGRVPPDEAFAFLEQRRGRLDGVVVSGGEPTLHPELPEFCRRIRELGFAVKLDTNGSRPEMLARLLAEGLVDYVAMDLKTDPERYGETVAPACDADTLRASVDAITRSGLDYEFRTTCVRPLVTLEAVERIARFIRGCRLYVLQPFRPGDILDPGFFDGDPGVSEAEMAELARAAERWVGRCIVR